MNDVSLTGVERAPEAQLQDLIDGALVTQLLALAARLGLADHMADGPRHYGEVAREVGADPVAVYRMLRALASRGVFAEQGDESGVFELTPVARLLRSDIDGSQREWAAMHGSDWMWRSIGHAGHSVQTGAPAFRDLFGTGTFQYFEQVPEEGELFYKAMRQVTEMVLPAALETYDFSPYSHAMDIGGGLGNLLAAILRAYPHMQGTLFDLPFMKPEAESFLAEQGVADRCSVVSGDFFEAIPEGADLHLLKWIIHDWSDEQATTILRNCRRALEPGGRLLLVEQVLPPRNEPSPAKMMDITMLLMEGGRERSEAEFARLFEDAGFRLTRCLPMLGPWSLIEGEPV